MITNTGLCFTCNHVIKGSTEIYVGLINSEGKKTVYKAKALIQNEDEDFAVIELEDCVDNYFYELEFDYKTLKTGNDVAIFGYPFGSALNDEIMELEPSLTKGYISSKNKINGHICYYLDIKSAPGNSGGPVFSLDTNKVIGYLCGSYGNDRSDIIFIKTLEYFLKNYLKD